MISEREWKFVKKVANDMSEELKIGMLGMFFNKKQLIEEIKKQTEFGKSYATMQLNFRDVFSVDLLWISKQIDILKTLKNHNKTTNNLEKITSISSHEGYLQALADMKKVVNDKFEKKLK